MNGVPFKEMLATEGEAAPLVGILAWNGARWVVTRYVSRRVAVSAARRGCTLYCKNASQAKSIARQAYGRNNVLRHGPNAHKRNPAHYSHYQPRSQKQRGHVFYGRRWR